VELPPAYGQLLSAGVLWISVHCAGMCGPLLHGLDVGGQQRGRSLGEGGLRVATYQLGKALTYGLLGAVAGLLGKGVSDVFTKQGALLFGVLAVVMAAYVVRRVWQRVKPRLMGATTSVGPLAEPPDLVQLGKSKHQLTTWEKLKVLGRQAVKKLAQDRSLTGTLGLGALLGFLPCMIPAWVLGLSASTSSALHGALLMLLLVALNTPIIALVTLLPRLLQQKLFAQREVLIDLSLAVSSTWMLLMALASADVIRHQAWHFTAFGKDLTLMFF